MCFNPLLRYTCISIRTFKQKRTCIDKIPVKSLLAYFATFHSILRIKTPCVQRPQRSHPLSGHNRQVGLYKVHFAACL